MIANMALDGLEAAVYAGVGSSKLARSKAQLNVVRYADDFVVTGASKDVLEFKVFLAVRQFLAVRGLELSEEKTRITNAKKWVGRRRAKRPNPDLANTHIRRNVGKRREGLS